MADTGQKKTLKLKKPGTAAKAPAPEADESQEAPAQDAGLPPPAMVRQAQDATPGTGASYTVAAICGIVAVLCLATLLVLQAMENAYYSDAILQQPYVAPVVPAQ